MTRIQWYTIWYLIARAIEDKYNILSWEKKKNWSYSFRYTDRVFFEPLLRRRLAMLWFWYLLDLLDLLGDETGENLTHEERNTFDEDLTHFLAPTLPENKTFMFKQFKFVNINLIRYHLLRVTICSDAVLIFPCLG